MIIVWRYSTSTSSCKQYWSEPRENTTEKTQSKHSKQTSVCLSWPIGGPPWMGLYKVVGCHTSTCTTGFVPRCFNCNILQVEVLLVSADLYVCTLV